MVRVKPTYRHQDLGSDEAALKPNTQTKPCVHVNMTKFR